jgi:hypothetical protein
VLKSISYHFIVECRWRFNFICPHLRNASWSH